MTTSTRESIPISMTCGVDDQRESINTNTPQQANATREGYRLNLQVIRGAALRKNIPFWNYFVRSKASAP